MKNLISFIVIAAFVLCMASIELARAGPKQYAVTHQAQVANASPFVVESVPPMTVGYDVICNLTTKAEPRVSNADQARAKTEAMRLSTTRADSQATARPEIVLLA